MRQMRQSTRARAKTQRQRLLAALRNGNTRSAACGLAGIHRATFYRWMEAETFRRRVHMAEAQAEGTMVSALFAAAQEDWRAALAWLERRRPLEWGRTIRLKDIDDATLDRLIEALLRGDVIL